LDALDRSGAEMIDDNHFASETIKVAGSELFISFIVSKSFMDACNQSAEIL